MPYSLPNATVAVGDVDSNDRFVPCSSYTVAYTSSWVSWLEIHSIFKYLSDNYIFRLFVSDEQTRSNYCCCTYAKQYRSTEIKPCHLISVVEREISCNDHAHALQLQSNPRDSSGMGTVCSRSLEDRSVPKHDVSDGEDYYEVRGSSGAILNPEMGRALRSSVDVHRGLVPKSSGDKKGPNGKGDKAGSVRICSAGNIDAALRRLEHGGRNHGSLSTTQRSKPLRSLPLPTGLGPALARG